jgi:hypothetical protein
MNELRFSIATINPHLSAITLLTDLGHFENVLPQKRTALNISGLYGGQLLY